MTMSILPLSGELLWNGSKTDRKNIQYVTTVCRITEKIDKLWRVCNCLHMAVEKHSARSVFGHRAFGRQVAYACDQVYYINNIE